jgi:hypothetical protein
MCIALGPGTLGTSTDRALYVLAAEAILVVALFHGRGRALLAVFLALFVISVIAAAHGLQGLDHVYYRGGGEDSLTYESEARSILDTGSLRGGESVFYYQPAMRYLQFGMHFVFGDSDALLFAIATAALTIAVSAGVMILLRSTQMTRGQQCAAAIGALLLLMLVTAPQVTDLIRAAYPEYPTWALLALSLPFVATRRSRHVALVVALLASCFLLRTNQAPLVSFLALLVLVHAWHRDRRAALWAAATFVALIFLPLVHNLWYGGRFRSPHDELRR